MRAVLVKLLIERQLVVNASVVEYVALHLDRSLDAARSFIDALDREALARRSRITRIMAAEVMERMKGVAAEGGI
jgi:chromosomal replication initiation ATPase DnaA